MMREMLLSLTLTALSTSLLCAVPGPKRPALPPPRAGNLLINGSFEQAPAFSTDFRSFNAGSREIKGWVVTRAQIDLVGPRWRGDHGQRFIDLHGTAGKGGIAQTFATRPGRIYVVNFALAGNPQRGERIKVLGVSAAGKSTSFTFDTRGKTIRNLGWVHRTWSFKATSTRTTLELFTRTPGGDAYSGPLIDHVSVVER